MQQVLTIVGSSARAAAVSAARSGFFVHAADLFADIDLCRIAQTTQIDDYPAGLGDIIRGPQPGAWLYTGAIENYPDLVDAWARHRPLWGNAGDVLRTIRNPELVAAALDRHGLHAPLVTTEVNRVPTDGTWLAKPLTSAGGLHIAPWRGRQSADLQPSWGPPDRWYFQQRVDGKSYSATFLSAAGQAVLVGVTEQLIGLGWTGGADFRYCGSVGPVVLSRSAENELLRIGELLAQRFHLVGLVGVDFIVNSTGVWLVEVNPRLTASVEVLERACGLHAIRMHAAACEQRRLPSADWNAFGKVAGKAIVFAPTRLQFLQNLATAMDAAEEISFPELADIPSPGTSIDAGWPIATVLAEGTSAEEVRTKLRLRAGRLLQACRLADKKK
jgi:predicted ATP-grasp superfamily ATP-dependent carboligase